MKILFLNVYYKQFLNSHYAKNDIKNKDYLEQRESIQGTMFGDSDFYSRGMEKKGWQAQDLITNCKALQRQWAKENDFDGDKHEIWIEQIRKYQPDVVYVQGLWLINDVTYPLIKDHCKLIVGQVGSRIETFAADKYDAMFTAIAPYVDRFIEAGTPAHYVPLAFEPRVLERVRPQARSMPLTYIGGMNAEHGRRKDVINALTNRFDMDLFINQKWGLDMFEAMSQSYMTVNCNIDVEINHVGNMRIYEATGCGALLLTNDGINMPELFEDDEVLKYNTPKEAVELAGYYLEHREEGKLIAERGQKRTLTDHTYEQRMSIVADVLEKML